ncbi:hypothetical protein GE061_001362 [Apolygus lucorum]|uniref:RNA-directed DNA polymerase n=1 Tax=Apolygus lucorum TaxID=248454 RepID=A0A8S9Y6V4_APOLU|nr:hypothetical protein GE061_001362 [Apolygus lucorum]
MNCVQLCFPIPDHTFFISTDASGTSLGAHLFQIDKDGEHYPIAFVSRMLNDHEKLYSVSELELLAISFGINKFRNYVSGVKFTVRTDHRALEHLHSAVLTSPRLSRLILALQEFDYVIEYVPGHQNLVADSLSRFTIRKQESFSCDEVIIAALELTPPITNLFQSFAQHQTEDPHLAHVLRRLGDSSQIGDYRIDNGLLYHRVRERWKIVIPLVALHKIILWVHEGYLHCGVKKCVGVISETFYHKALRKHTRIVLRTCQICQMIKTTPTLNAPLLSIPASKPRDLIAIDFYGPLPQSGDRFRYILVVLDIASKFVRLYPIIKASGAAVLDCLLLDYVPQYGQIKAVLSDNGTQFGSRLWISKLRQANIKNIRTSIRHPSANPAERYMGTLAQYMRAALFDKSHDLWYDQLADVEISMNETPHSATGLTPVALFLGRRVNREWYKILPTNAPLELTSTEMDESLRNAKLQSERMSQDRAKRFNESRRLAFTHFNLGDRVLVKSLNVSSSSQRRYHKFMARYCGPFRIAKNYHNGSYLLVDENGRTKGVYHVTNIKKYYPPVIETFESS